jgi:hypothetical protein
MDKGILRKKTVLCTANLALLVAMFLMRNQSSARPPLPDLSQAKIGEAPGDGDLDSFWKARGAILDDRKTPPVADLPKKESSALKCAPRLTKMAKCHNYDLTALIPSAVKLFEEIDFLAHQFWCRVDSNGLTEFHVFENVSGPNVRCDAARAMGMRTFHILINESHESHEGLMDIVFVFAPDKRKGAALLLTSVLETFSLTKLFRDFYDGDGLKDVILSDENHRSLVRKVFETFGFM